MAKTKHLQVSLGFGKLPDADLVPRTHAVATNPPGNPAYPAPPVDPAAFKTDWSDTAMQICA